jgi:hypothetical protein
MIKAIRELGRWLDRNNFPKNRIKVTVEVCTNEDLRRLQEANSKDYADNEMYVSLLGDRIVGIPTEVKVVDRRKGDRRRA